MSRLVQDTTIPKLEISCISSQTFRLLLCVMLCSPHIAFHDDRALYPVQYPPPWNIGNRAQARRLQRDISGACTHMILSKRVQVQEGQYLVDPDPDIDRGSRKSTDSKALAPELANGPHRRIFACVRLTMSLAHHEMGHHH